MNKKFISSIVLILVVFTSGILSGFSNVLDPTRVVLNEHIIMAHAGGGFDGINYLNAKESFLPHYNEGTRVFEYDFVLSSDNEVITSHIWDDHIFSGTWSCSNRPTL